MRRIFSPQSPYTRQARFVAVLWTLLIFVACFTPAKDIPQVNVPLIDKWTHLVLFGVFTFLWLCTNPSLNARWLITIFLMAVGLGTFIELMQGALKFLGRSMEFLDGVADAIGALLGMGLFSVLARLVK